MPIPQHCSKHWAAAGGTAQTSPLRKSGISNSSRDRQSVKFGNLVSPLRWPLRRDWRPVVIRRSARSILQAQLQGENRDRAAVAIVGRVVDELIVECALGEAGYGDAVIGFEDLLGAGIGQLAVADDPAQTAGGEVQLALVRDPVDCACQSDSVVRPPPARAGQRETRRNRLV